MTDPRYSVAGSGFSLSEKLKGCTPKWLAFDSDFEGHARQLGIPPLEIKSIQNPALVGTDADGMLIVCTSGTTGTPKRAVLAQQALLWNGFNSIHAHDQRQSGHVLTALPMFHVGSENVYPPSWRTCSPTARRSPNPR